MSRPERRSDQPEAVQFMPPFSVKSKEGTEMLKRMRTGIVLLGFLFVGGTAAQIAPVAVSPGSDRGVAVVGQACPTFSWTAVDWASGYRVAVFEALGVQIPSYEEMAAGMAPVLSKEIAGKALAWTPSAEEQLIAGNLYVWYVQAADASGQGAWSKGKAFIVETGNLFAEAEDGLRKALEDKGVREDVISGVLKETRIEGKGVLAGKVESKPQGRVGALGSEGPNNVLYGTNAGYSLTTGALNTFVGLWAGYANTTAWYNSFVGYAAGSANTIGQGNSFYGYGAGDANTTGNYNSSFGMNSGAGNTWGSYNSCFGYQSGLRTEGGLYNTFLGSLSGRENTSGSSNTFVGYYSGYSNTTASSNTFVGSMAGRSNTTGSNNVFLGYQAGYNETGSGKLYIANSATSTPLVYGDFSSGVLGVNGWLGVGTQAPAYPMEVKTSGRNSVLVVQRPDGALNFMNASTAYGQFGTGNAYPVRILVNSAWRMSLNLDNSLTMVNGASCTAGGVWTDASSRELKENIKDLSVAEAEEALRDLVPVKYNYKVDKAERHVGFIAEDVPELVASKDRKTMSPMNVVGVLTKVMQELDKKLGEQQKVILEQQKGLAEQKKTISELKDEVSKLKRQGTLDK
jgi:hypothetical protein